MTPRDRLFSAARDPVWAAALAGEAPPTASDESLGRLMLGQAA